jgi:C4-dicarboxylate-specific signal transduction histidine kinase
MGMLVPRERIEQTILVIRGQRVILDSDLAKLYGVSTKVLNQAVKRNTERFPGDFAFQLTAAEVRNLRSQAVTLSSRPVESIESNSNRSQFVTGSQKHRDPRFRPWAFTEHGAVMVASVLNSKRAVEVSLYVVRAFVKLREMLRTHKALAQKLAELERQVASHDSHIRSLFEAIRQLMEPAAAKSRRIGFKT